MVNMLRVNFESEKKQVKLSVNGMDNKFTSIKCQWEC